MSSPASPATISTPARRRPLVTTAADLIAALEDAGKLAARAQLEDPDNLTAATYTAEAARTLFDDIYVSEREPSDADIHAAIRILGDAGARAIYMAAYLREILSTADG